MMKKNFRTYATTLIVLASGALVSCSPGPSTPEGLLRMYVNDITTKSVGKDYYLKYTAGELKSSVEEMDEEEIKKSSYMENVKRAKVEVLNKNCQEAKCVLTYTVSYDTVEGDKATFSSETKKLAEFVKQEDEWKISSVTNLKTFIEAKEPISPLEEN